MQADPTTRPDEGAPDPQEGEAPQARPLPDGPGPHDVPDGEVIDKTLPSKPVGGADRPG